MQRTTVYPRGHWSLKVAIPYSMGVKAGRLFFLSGQADLAGQGEVCHPHDLYSQSAAAIEHIRTIVTELNCRLDDLVKLTVYYVNNGEVDEAVYIEHLAAQLATDKLPVITLVALTHFFYPGVMVEIDAFGMQRTPGIERVSIASDQHVFPQLLRQEEIIFVGGLDDRDAEGRVLAAGDVVRQSHGLLGKLDALLAGVGAGREDVVKINNWYAGGATVEQWAQSARIRADYYPEPGPVATGIPVHALYPAGVGIQTDIWAMLAPDGSTLPKQHCWPAGHWDWPIHLPFKHGLRCGELLFTGGQVSLDARGAVIDPGDMLSQTRTSMDNVARVLAGLGGSMQDIVKLNTFYQGSDDPAELHRNVNIRSSYFERPGPASTGIPFDHLAYEDMLIEIEVIAICDSS